MNDPKQPAEPGTDDGVSPAHNPTGTTPDGVPESADENEAKGYPNSDREKSEKAMLP